MKKYILLFIVAALLFANLNLADEAVTDANEVNDHVKDLTDNDINTIKSGIWLVEFFAPWCGYCKRLAPIWSELGIHVYREKMDVNVARVNCDEHKALCGEHGIRGYPTIKLFVNGVKKEYRGGRTIKQFTAYLDKMISGTITKVNDKSAFESIIKEDSSKVSIIYVAKPGLDVKNDPLYEAYSKKTVELFDLNGPNFIELTDASFIDPKLKLPAIVLYRDERFITFDKPVSQLSQWMTVYQFPPLSKITDSSFAPLTEQYKYLVIFAHDNVPTPDEMELMKKISRVPVSDDPFEFGFSYIIELDYSSWLKKFEIQRYPTVLVVRDKGELFYYDPELKQLDDIQVPKFLKEIKAGNVQMKYTDITRFYFIKVAEFLNDYAYHIVAVFGVLMVLLLWSCLRPSAPVASAKGDKDK